MLSAPPKPERGPGDYGYEKRPPHFRHMLTVTAEAQE
jgi:hypothetical protein